jgi:hypothetical protein
VQRLIVVDIAPKSYPPLYEELIKTLLKLDINKISRLRQVEEQLRTKIPDEDLKFFLLKNLERGNDGHYSWKVNLKAIRDSYAKLSTSVTGKPFEKPCLLEIVVCLKCYGSRLKFALKIQTCIVL